MSYNAQHAQESLQNMDNLLTRIINLSKDIGTFHDGIHLREQIQNSVQELMKLSRSVKAEIEDLKSNEDESNNSELRASFEALSVKIKGALPDVIASLRSADTPQKQPNLSYIEPAPHQNAKNKLSMELINTPLLDQSTIDQETDQLDVLESEVNAILRDMREINSLFNKTMQELQSQRHLLAGVDTITTGAAKDMKKGNDQLDKAESHMKGSRKALCAILIIVFVVILGVAGFLTYYFLKKKKDKENQ